MLIGWFAVAVALAVPGSLQEPPPRLGTVLGSTVVRRFSGERVDLGAIRGRYVVLYRAADNVSDGDLRLADRLVRMDTHGMSVQICVLSHDSVDRLASLVSTKGASPVLYSFAETTFEAVRPGDVLLLNPNGFLIRRWDGVSPEAIPEAVEAWFGRDAPAPGEVVPRLPSMESWHEGKRLLLFLSTDSPVVELYLQRIRNLAAEARKAGIAVYGVFSDAAETEEGVAAFARASDFEFDCVRDAGGAIADVCAVRVAPTAVLLDEKGAVQYAGAIDSSTFGGEETREYLLSAIRALAAGAKPAVGYARPFGTGIVVYREGANPLSSRALASGRE